MTSSKKKSKPVTLSVGINSRWSRFKRNRMGVVSLGFFALLIIFSGTAELWSNSKPVYLQYQGRHYFPFLIDYHPTEFGREDIFIMDYQNLELNHTDFALWPLNPWDPYQSNSALDQFPSPPTKLNIFGTDDRGRDVFARILYGFRYTLAYALGVWILSYSLGIVFGAITGYRGGVVDILGMRMLEIFESMPTLLLLLTMISIFSPSIYLLIGFSVLFGWMSIATYVRAEFLTLRKREFVDSARVLGVSPWRIVFFHILPNALTPVITFSPFMVAGSILTLTNMDYLGLGLPPPTPSWGELLGQAQKYITIAEWLVWWPSFFLVLTLVLLINIGLAIRDAFDSKTSPL